MKMSKCRLATFEYHVKIVFLPQLLSQEVDYYTPRDFYDYFLFQVWRSHGINGLESEGESSKFRKYCVTQFQELGGGVCYPPTTQVWALCRLLKLGNQKGQERRVKHFSSNHPFPKFCLCNHESLCHHCYEKPFSFSLLWRYKHKITAILLFFPL